MFNETDIKFCEICDAKIDTADMDSKHIYLGNIILCEECKTDAE